MNFSPHVQFLLFADNTTVFLKGNDLGSVSRVYSWLIANQLMLNYSKPQYFIKYSSRLLPDHPVITRDNILMTQATQIKI